MHILGMVPKEPLSRPSRGCNSFYMITIIGHKLINCKKKHPTFKDFWMSLDPAGLKGGGERGIRTLGGAFDPTLA
jgi:hypothetical protein